MRILLLGATGRTGKLVLTSALKEGYSVNCLVRKPDKTEAQDGMQVFEGNPSDEHALQSAMEGCECIMSVLNISRHTDFPWSALRTPENYLSEVMSQVIPMAEERNIQRIIICSAWGVAETKKDIPGWFRWFIENSNIGKAYEDHERQEQLLMQSNLNWTIIRPAGLTNSRKKQEIRESFNDVPKPALTIGRQSVARYMVSSIDNEQLIKQTVVISKN
ncbi:MAG: NAD(P)-binding oxidoreductase [Reichenbachiella sp.]|uniref:NAD(P)-dependent oxidoreductase n=1 Tax=Reichenbachiella sp. TaxID=2184521 RepID=UPI0032656251